MTYTTVNDIPAEYQFVSDSQDVSAIKDSIGPAAAEYDSFFVLVGDGDYIAVYGMDGSVPSLGKRVYLVRE